MTNNEIKCNAKCIFNNNQTFNVYNNISSNTITFLFNSDAIYDDTNEVIANGFWKKG